MEVCGNFVVNHRLFRLFAYLPRDRADGGDKISLRANIRGEPSFDSHDTLYISALNLDLYEFTVCHLLDMF